MSHSRRIPEDLTSHCLLNSAQTAYLLGFSSVHLRRLVKSGRVPKPLRIGERKLA